MEEKYFKNIISEKIETAKYISYRDIERELRARDFVLMYDNIGKIKK